MKLDAVETLDRRPCPACSAAEPDLIFEQRFAPVEAASLLSGYDVVACRACGCAYADRVPPQAAFDAYYRDLSKYDHAERAGGESPLERERSAAIAADIASQIPDRAARIVEIGCSTGGLLAALWAQGFTDLLGVDPSPYSGEAAHRFHRVRVVTGTLSEDLGIGRSADLVVAIGVLEHIRDVGLALQRIRGLLRPGGTLYVEVPDALRFADWLDAPYQQFSVEHVTFFSPESLNRALAGQGFQFARVAQVTRAESESSTMPVVAALSTAVASGVRGAPPPADARSAPALRQYVARSAAMDERIQTEVDRLARAGRPLLVWGVGTHTARLLVSSRLRQARICAFIDSNPKMHGKMLDGIPILPPEALRARDEPVLISSRVFQDEIAAQIGRLGCANELVFLYDR